MNNFIITNQSKKEVSQKPKKKKKKQKREHDICMHVVHYLVIWMTVLTVYRFERDAQSATL